MTHELGHILIGGEYHSANPRSAMYWTTKEHGQKVTDEDRARVVDRGALAKVGPSKQDLPLSKIGEPVSFRP
jgi:hypothetical protein